MTETMDQLIQARFDRVASRTADDDWSDVLARAGGARRSRHMRAPRRIALVAAVAVGGAVVTAVALGLPQAFIDFFSSPPAPAHIKNWFGALSVGAPRGMDPRAIAGEARKIATARFDVDHLHGGHPTSHTLYVAPRKGGGFCYLWTNADGGCLPARPQAKTAARRATGPLGISWFSNNNVGYPVLVDGWVRTGSAKTVEARFADGKVAAIPVTWVSSPVDAGFLVYPVPQAHRDRRHALTAVVALGSDGTVVGKESFRLTKPLDEDVMQTLPDGSKVSLPRRAQADKARKIISFRATDGSGVYLWVMPRAGGGLCYLANQSEGCLDPRFAAQTPVLNGGIEGGASRVLFEAETKRKVAAVVLRFQNGVRQRLTPIEGFVLTEITPAHYKRGTRPVAAVALNRDGKPIYTERLRPQSVGVYPCKKPQSLGYGVKACR